MKKLFLVFTLFWMSFIFYFSHQPANISDVHSDKAISVLNYIIKDVNIKKYNSIEFIVRKSAHFSLYFILGILLTISIYIITKNINKSYILGFIFSVIYSISDEFHQKFISGRSSEIRDIGIDTLGIMCGIIILSMILKIKYIIKPR